LQACQRRPVGPHRNPHSQCRRFASAVIPLGWVHAQRQRQGWTVIIRRGGGQPDRPHRAWALGAFPLAPDRLGERFSGSLDGLQDALDGHFSWKRSFKKALTSSWDLFAAASW